MIINGITVEADASLTTEEVKLLVAEEQEYWRNRSKSIAHVEIVREGDEIVINAQERSPIRRVRRITGYLSNIDNFNDAKKQECEKRYIHAS